jgi:L-fuconolactonase
MNDLVIDCHQHFWDLGRFQYYWLTPQVEALRRDFLPDDLIPLLSREGIDRTIVIQAHKSYEEAQWLLELAARHDFIAGVVAWADLTSPSLGEALDELQRHSKLLGIRHPIEDESDDAWMVREEVLTGFEELERREIPYELLVWPRHLKYIPALRERCPYLKLVVDHVANPPIARGVMDAWANDLAVVASLPNIFCKLSGMITQVDWSTESLRPYVAHAVQVFGCDRLMFGSDWPVCTLGGSYGEVVGALRDVLAGASPKEASRVWGQTAVEFYRLPCL